MYKLIIRCFAIGLTALAIVSCSTGKQQKAEADTEPAEVKTESPYKISLAQWSLNKSYFGPETRKKGWEWFRTALQEYPDSLLQGEIDPFNFPQEALKYGVNTIELVNTFYFGKVNDMAYWEAFKSQCDSLGVNVGLIMCDALGSMGAADSVERMTTVENHYAWVDVAAYLGAKSVRVNARGEGTAEEVAANAAKGLAALGEYGASKGVNIIVENHGGYSSDGAWLAGVMKAVNMDNVGTLPDFGNFCIERGEEGCANEYDRYQGMAELMPYAKGVSAKANLFDENGDEANMDYLRIMNIVKEAGFEGYVGIEYEGSELSEDEGIKATKALLEKVFAQL